MKQQQALLTTFLRTATGGATSPLRTAANSPRRASPPLTTTNTAAKNEADIPWPEIDLTGNQTSPSSTSTASSSSSSSSSTSASSSSSPYTPLKRKAAKSSSSKKSGKIEELQLPSPKRAKKAEEATLPALGVVLGEGKQPDSLEDVEEFDDEEQKKKKEMEFTDEELIAISEQIERSGHSDAASAGKPVPGGVSSPLRPVSSAAASSPHPFFARGGRGKRWGKEFYEHDCETLAKMLLGQVLVRITSDNQRLAGRIVETEAYLGGEDKGAHSYGGKITAKNKSMYEPPGTAYIYKIYVTNFCFNVSSLGDGAAVLVRALEPVEGLARMRTNRMAGKVSSSATVRDQDLTSGPGKSCQALELNLVQDGIDLITSEELWIEEGKKIDERNIVAGPRINIDYAGEWKDKPLRFHVKGNPHVSKPAFSNNKSPFRGGKKV